MGCFGTTFVVDQTNFRVVLMGSLQPGDEIVFPGSATAPTTYSVSETCFVTWNGAAQNPIIVRAVEIGGAVLQSVLNQPVLDIVQGSHFRVSGLKIVGASVGIRLGSGPTSSDTVNHAVFEDIEIFDVSEHHIRADMPSSFVGTKVHSHIQFRRLHLHNSPGSGGNCMTLGIRLSQSGSENVYFENSLVEYCYIHSLTRNLAGANTGIVLSQQSNNNVFRYNVFHTLDQGIYLFDDFDRGANQIYGNVMWSVRNFCLAVTAGASIHNNIFMDCFNHGIMISNYMSPTKTGAIPRNLSILFNTILRNNGCLVIGWPGMVNVTIANNLFFCPGRTAILVGNNDPVTVEFGPNAIIGAVDAYFGRVVTIPHLIQLNGTIADYTLNSGAVDDVSSAWPKIGVYGIVGEANLSSRFSPLLQNGDFNCVDRGFSTSDLGAYHSDLLTENPGWPLSPSLRPICNGQFTTSNSKMSGAFTTSTPSTIFVSTPSPAALTSSPSLTRGWLNTSYYIDSMCTGQIQHLRFMYQETPVPSSVPCHFVANGLFEKSEIVQGVRFPTNFAWYRECAGAYPVHWAWPLGVCSRDPDYGFVLLTCNSETEILRRHFRASCSEFPFYTQERGLGYSCSTIDPYTFWSIGDSGGLCRTSVPTSFYALSTSPSPSSTLPTMQSLSTTTRMASTITSQSAFPTSRATTLTSPLPTSTSSMPFPGSTETTGTATSVSQITTTAATEQVPLALILGAALGGAAVLGLVVMIPVARMQYVRAHARSIQVVEMQGSATSHPFVEIEESASSEERDELTRVLAIKEALAAVPTDVAALRKLSKSGVPTGLRANAWIALMELGKVHKPIPISSTPCRFESQLEVDIRRANVGHPVLGTPEGMSKLHKVLQTFFVVNPSLEYWQGLDSLFSIVLLVFLPDHEDMVVPAANALVQRFLSHILQSGEAGPLALIRELDVFWVLLQYRDPELVLHLESVHVTASVFAVPWFVALFSTCFPVDEVAIILDWIIASPVNLLPFLAVSILVTQRQSLLELKDQTSMLMRLRQINDRTIQGGELKKVGSMARKLSQSIPTSILEDPIEKDCAYISEADKQALAEQQMLVCASTSEDVKDLKPGLIVLCQGLDAKTLVKQLIQHHIPFVVLLKGGGGEIILNEREEKVETGDSKKENLTNEAETPKPKQGGLETSSSDGEGGKGKEEIENGTINL